ncbi:MAG TPA: DUF3422 domain-containing protein [Methylibium sp.]|uniref:DUF3422 family protein n=1 Tax=Methylibium sp. TaxID=2067992 RepID=UPI002DBA96A0|nr:DUF3422 domain-containing protein [Methylibium sp.]HEU4459609.1 DUF3422 domain-containing protein [Methylibium sp.]
MPTTPCPHPLRTALYNEVHARPYERMQAPLAFSHLAFVCDAGAREAERAHLETLLTDLHLPVPAADANHLSVELPGCRLRWERHTEFVAYTVLRGLKPGEALDATPAHRSLPEDWLAAMPGQLLVASRGLVLMQSARPLRELADRWLEADTLVAAGIADGDLQVFGDLRLHPDGYGRWLVGVGNAAMSQRRLGRYLQRLLEIDTYRMMALLGLPAARAVTRRLDELEPQLAQLAASGHGTSLAEETAQLDALTRLAREIEGAYAQHHGRFSASSAYFALVEQRIDELREERIEGLQTIREFVDRRLKPAMTTTAWASRRLGALSERVSRASELLRTRVEIEQQEQAHQMLGSMNRRQQLQLRLQAAVESLSVAAITYYGAGLVGYLAKGLYAARLPVPVELVVAASVPLIAISAWLGLRKLRRRVEA